MALMTSQREAKTGPVVAPAYASPPRAELKGLRISFPLPDMSMLEVISGISMSVAEGEFVAVVGPSGSGKSTILRALCGLLKPSGGEVTVDGKPVSGPPPGVGFMFQKDALLPWRTVAGNIRIGAELGSVPADQHEARIASLIKLLRLEGFENAWPRQLSGGMRQRVSLGRLLAYQPSLMLMDEPFGALDYQTKIAMGRELLSVWEAERRSIIFVTHDIEEAVTLADRVVVFSARPARIIADYKVDIPRPRHLRAMRSDPVFTQLTEAIWSDLAMPS
ncbi:NitT/TauT family transport system ATP-binding protein [Phyllobacterium trifolii]|uniref:NitT/TauT family transport system ATP-binding protein n=1 Tax=Phyllobacterium trifolii TaxID=300193 RepID=A0A839UIV3_9HYPH|nr:ABC transporter ATP-binding protein [Phyllobacterium trifolii]MBB3148469.1 NitT/TauT family transport system ATP-binding protein [Phyllobacterium trifolii]